MKTMEEIEKMTNTELLKEYREAPSGYAHIESSAKNAHRFSIKKNEKNHTAIESIRKYKELLGDEISKRMDAENLKYGEFYSKYNSYD